MAQTEMMLRLIKDGKIVGYENHFQDFEGEIQTFYGIEINKRTEMVELNKKTDVPMIHDSFEFGIKVGDKWWFEEN